MLLVATSIFVPGQSAWLDLTSLSWGQDWVQIKCNLSDGSMFGISKRGSYKDVRLKIGLGGNSGFTANITGWPNTNDTTKLSCCESNWNTTDPKGYTTHCGPNVTFILSKCNSSLPVSHCMVNDSDYVRSTLVVPTTPFPTPEPVPVDVIYLGATDVFSLSGGKTILNGETLSGVRSYKWSFQRYGEPTFDLIGVTYMNYGNSKSNCGISHYYKKKTENCSYEFVFNQTRKSDYGFYKRQTLLTNGTLVVELFNVTVYHLKPVLSPVSYVGGSLRFKCKDTLNPELSTYVKYIYSYPEGNMKIVKSGGEITAIKRKRKMLPLEVQMQCCTLYGTQMQSVCSQTSTLYLGYCTNGSGRECSEMDFNRGKESHFSRKSPKEMCTRTIQSTTEHMKACEGHWVGIRGDFTGWLFQVPTQWAIKNPVNYSEEELIAKNGTCLSPRYGDCGRLLIVKKVDPKDERWYKVSSRSYIDMAYLSVSERIAVTLELVSMNNSQVTLQCSVNSNTKVDIKWDIRDGNLQPYSEYGNETTKTIRYGCKSGLMHTGDLTVGCSAINDAWMGESNSFRIRRSEKDCSIVPPFPGDISKYKVVEKNGVHHFSRKIYHIGDGH